MGSWDEAWYGAIAKNLLSGGNPFRLYFAGQPYFDHPPLGFWLQAMALKIFGVTEFGVRFPAAFLGFATLIVVYLLGKKIFTRAVGLFSALGLAVAPWFLLRSRSGNFDLPLTFFFALSFYLAYISAENKKYLYALGLSLSLLFLTKSLVPFVILPSLAVILWPKVKPKDLIKPLILFLVLPSLWFLFNWQVKPDLWRHYLAIGFPASNGPLNLWQNVLNAKVYFHHGIGNWFRLGFVAVVFGTVLFRRKFLPLSLFIVLFLLPFAVSSRGQIWHFIPVYPFWILLMFGFCEQFMQKIIKSKKDTPV